MSAHNIVPFHVYRNVLLALLGLTILTVLLSSRVTGFHAGIFNFAIAMGIASVKAGLVLSYFMQLKYDNKLYLVIIVSTVLFLALLFGICTIDILTRPPEVSTL